jgi:hypothetical protein
MEIYGPFLQEDEVFVEEARRRKDFNNFFMHFPALPGDNSYRNEYLSSINSAKAFHEDVQEVESDYRENREMWKSIDEWVLKNDFNVTDWLVRFSKVSGCPVKREEVESELALLYIHLRRQGFNTGVIYG